MTQPPRTVLYLHSTSEIGGSDISLMRIVETLDRTRFLPRVALPADGPLVARLRQLGCTVLIVKEMKKLTAQRGRWYLAAYVLNYPKAVRRIVEIIRREGIDLVHTNTIHSLYGWLAAWLARRPHVWHIREIVWQSRLLRRLEVFLATHFSDRLIVTSRAVAGMFSRDGRSYPKRLRKIPNCIDLERFRPETDGRQTLHELGIPAGVPLVGLICRLDRWKGVEVFLHAVSVCRARHPDARFLVVGGPIEGHEGYADELRRLAHALGLANVVVFTGWRFQPVDMPRLYAALTIAVLASTEPEPFGLVLLEAMASGKPVVATNHGGPKEICVDGETGLLVPPGDPMKLAAAISQLLLNPQQARAMGAAGRTRVERLFDQRRYAGALEAVYDEVFIERTRRGSSRPGVPTH